MNSFPNGLTIETDLLCEETFSGFKFKEGSNLKIDVMITYRATNGGITGGLVYVNGELKKTVELFDYSSGFPHELKSSCGPFDFVVESGDEVNFEITTTRDWSGVFDECKLIIKKEV